MTAVEDESPDLKRCPFCGGDAMLRRVWTHHNGGIDEETYYMVGCTKHPCHAQIGRVRHKTRERAVEVWNRRHKENSPCGSN